MHPQLTIQMLCELTGGNGVLSTGLGAMGFSLPAALGDTATNPDIPVIDIDGDGSFIMNELVTILVEKLPVKIMMLNNQHLGTVVQWEDRFCKADCVHTYLGDPEDEADIFHNSARWLKVTRCHQHK